MQQLIKANFAFTANEKDPVRKKIGVLIKDGIINTVDSWENFSHLSDPTINVIDASNYTLMPGLIDCHVHANTSGDPAEKGSDYDEVRFTAAQTTLYALRNAQRQTDMGVTTIRDLGCRDWVTPAIRDSIYAGWYKGPRMVVAVRGITSTGGHMDVYKLIRPDWPAVDSMGCIADGPDGGRRAVRTQIRDGADVIKINATISEYVRAIGGECTPEMTFETLKAICDTAHTLRKRVAAHCHGGPGVRDAIEAGVDTFEHGYFIDDELMEEMAKRDRFLTPTMCALHCPLDNNDLPTEPALLKWYKIAIPATMEEVKRAKKHGVKILAGTDAGMPYVWHGMVSQEMIYLAKYGLTNLEALAAATRVAADGLDMKDKIGQIKTGLFADLIMVKGDPTKDLTVLQKKENIVFVMQGGEIFIDRR
jgi:imidazolonepropionase-like amidohydrolase